MSISSRRRDMGLPEVALIIAVSLVLVFGFAALGCPDDVEPRLHYGMLTGSETLIGLKNAADRHVVLFARAQGDYQIKGCLHGAGRAEGSALGDGGSGGVNLQDPNSFTTLELYVTGYCQAAPNFALGGVFGGVVDVEKGLPAATSAPKTYGAFLFLGQLYHGRYVGLGYGVHQASGPGNRILFAVEWPIAKNLSVVADGALPTTVHPGATNRPFMRLGLAVYAPRAEKVAGK